MPSSTYPSSTTVAGRPLSSCSSSYLSYVPRKPSPLAEGASTSPPSSESSSSVVLASPNPSPSPPDSPRSLTFTDAPPPSMLCPKPTHSKSLPSRVQTVHRPATAGLPRAVPASPHPHPHRRIQSTSTPALVCTPVAGTVAANPRQASATEAETRTGRPALRPVTRPSTSRVPEENWMTSESAPRFTRQSLVLGAVVLPVRKLDAQHARRQSGLKYGTPVRCAAVDSTPTLTRSWSSSETVVEKKDACTIPSVQVVGVDGTVQAVDEVGAVVDADLALAKPKRDGAGTKKAASLGHVRKLLSRDFAAKRKIRSGQVQVKPIVAVPDPALTQKRAVEKEESGPDPRPSGAPLKRARTLLGYILGI